MLVAIIAMDIAAAIALISLLSVANSAKANKIQLVVTKLENCKNQLIAIETAIDVFKATGNEEKVKEYEEKKSKKEAECKALLSELDQLKGN